MVKRKPRQTLSFLIDVCWLVPEICQVPSTTWFKSIEAHVASSDITFQQRSDRGLETLRFLDLP